MKWPWFSPKESDATSRAATQRTESEATTAWGIASLAKKALPDALLALTPWAKKGEVKGEVKDGLREPSHKGTDIIRQTIKSKLEEKPQKRRLTPQRIRAVDNEDFSVGTSSSAIHLYNEERGTFEPIDHFNVFIPEHLRADTVPLPRTSPESNWHSTFHHLATLAEEDERYDPRKIRIFAEKGDGPYISSSSSEESTGASGVVSLVNMTPQSSTARVPDANLSTAFLYRQRPFRQPKLAEVEHDLSGEISSTDIFKFAPIRVSSTDWSNIQPGDDTDGVFAKWSLPEPMRADKRLMPQIDPLVRYKLKRQGRNRVTPAELLETQNELALGLSPSGRKLDGYSSSSAEECVYKQVLCRDDPDFDIVEPFVETESGEKWPHPFLYYCNWKKTDENANEGYLSQERESDAKNLTQRRRIALEICSDPLKIPYQYLGADDTDYEDPLGPLYKQPAVTLVLDLFNHLWKSKSAKASDTSAAPFRGIVIADPVVRRYQYLSLDKYTNAYRKYYQCVLKVQAQKRGCYRVYVRLRGTCTSGCVTSYPVWFYFWKGIIRHAVKKVPRKWKFCDERKTQTVFYGTFSSIYETQYIAEHDLLPNMDDPVAVSQMALQRAMEIKEQFLKYSELEGGRPYVDYIELQRSKEYEKYMECIGLLCRYQPIKMSPRVRKVFFLNYFNVLSIQTQILRIPEQENTTYLWEMNHFWEKTKGLAGCLELSLEDIYHGILRCNRIHPTKQTKVFEEPPAKGYPKEMSPSRLSLDWMDPRIHFALNIGCKSCPPIPTFSLYEQDCQLDEVARNYVRGRVKINYQRRRITLPDLFLWYEKDFGNNQYVMLWYLKQYMVSKDMLKVRKMLTSGKSIRLRYRRFDYELDHIVRRYPDTKCPPAHHKRIIPMYWGSKY